MPMICWGLKIVDSGVKKCNEPKFAGHVWIEYPEGSCGNYPTGSIWWSPRKVENPDPYVGDVDKECYPIKLDDCACDIKKFVACIEIHCSARINGYYQVIIHHCGVWAGDTILLCLMAARR